MRRIWPMAALAANGCAALLHGGQPGYPDADLARFAVATTWREERPARRTINELERVTTAPGDRPMAFPRCP
jgi:hypothetical protein